MAITGLGHVPVTGPGGSYLLTGGGGFISIFTDQGAQTWSTTIHAQPQALEISKTSCIIAATASSSFATSTCSAVSGMVSVCDPGGAAYVQTTGGGAGDHYLAEFDLNAGTLIYSTFMGGTADEFANILIGSGDILDIYDPQPFLSHRLLDLESDSEGSVFMLGHTSKPTVTPVDYPTVPNSDFYNQPFLTVMNRFQTDMVLALWRPDRSLAWVSTLGGHIPSGPSDTFIAYDYTDVGTRLALAEGEALYVVGATGGAGYPYECPFPGVSYCDNFAGAFLDGSITRFNLDGIYLSTNDMPAGSGGMLIYPVPAGDAIQIPWTSDIPSGSVVRIHDMLGRLVLSAALSPSPLDITSLNAACYAVVIEDRNGTKLAAARFVKQ